MQCYAPNYALGYLGSKQIPINTDVGYGEMANKYKGADRQIRPFLYTLFFSTCSAWLSVV
jgi:hypothetical protein